MTARPAGRAERAPAKLNLGLRIVGRRGDGYHLLDSVFVAIDLADRIWVEADPSGPKGVALEVDGGPRELADPARNLAARAASAFLEAAGLEASVRVLLEKRVPVGAGLGGGSSDAGAVLRALAGCFPRAIGAGRLAELALALGADVPFFLDPRPARVSGVGECIAPLSDWPAFPVLVATPAPPLPTAEVFEAWDRSPGALTPSEPGRNLARLPALLAARTADRAADSELTALLGNDLEPAATRLRPGIARVRAEIERAGARAVGMSGSGPSVFGVFRDERSAQAAAERGRWEASDRVHVGRTLASWGVV